MLDVLSAQMFDIRHTPQRTWPWWPPLGRPLYTSDAADDLLCVDLGGRRLINEYLNTLTHLTLFYH